MERALDTHSSRITQSRTTRRRKKKNEIGLTGSRRCALANRIPNLHNFWTQVILLTLVAVAAAGELHPIAILKQNIETQLDGS